MKVLKMILRLVALLMSLRILKTLMVLMMLVEPPKFMSVISESKMPVLEAKTIMKPKTFQPSLKKLRPCPISLMQISMLKMTVKQTLMNSTIVGIDSACPYLFNGMMRALIKMQRYTKLLKTL